MSSDAELVCASRGGDRQAFGQIVRKYQGMVSGLIYAACGDLHRSEDLAQETFLSAWKSLSGLREPAKLPAWLCQIARHRAQDQLRRTTTEKIGIGGFWGRIRQATSPAADEQLIRKEEEAVLWRALAEVPPPYRETLVLYYRQGRSTEEVAAATDTSEASVRQRLARGREMLRSEVSELLERNLTRTAPSSAFAVAVVAALPAVAPQAAQAVGVGTAVKGTLAQTAWLAGVVAWIGCAGGLLSGIVGTQQAMREAKTPQQRRATGAFLTFIWMAVVALMGGCVAVFILREHQRWSDSTFIAVLAGMFSLYWGFLTALIQRHDYHAHQLRKADPAATPPPSMSNSARICMAAGPTIAALAWMIQLALAARDGLAIGIVVLAIVAISAWGVWWTRRSPLTLMLGYTLAFCGMIVLMLNWRLDVWLAAMRNAAGPAAPAPLWSVNAAALTLVLWAIAVTLFWNPRSQALAPR